MRNGRAWLAVAATLWAAAAAEPRPNWRAKYRRLLPFHVARTAARTLGFDRAAWDEWVAEGKSAPSLGPYMPSAPDEMYAAEWLGWDDWLGCMRTYEDARAEVRKFGIATQEEWWRFVDEDASILLEMRVPARPHIYYDDWQGYDHWLSQAEAVMYPPRPSGEGDYDNSGYPGATG